ncbi:MAG TPA: hypothetical protein VM030_08165 [Acidimicrobiales bacterium]|nr:hypothetical protein [Acidimicrobiales bacterium]
MTMRVDCKYYESRTYASGETVRMCRLDLAPEAPWRCPEDCQGYRRRMVDVGWSHGSLAADPGPPEPTGLDAGGAELLEMAEEILNTAGHKIVAEEQAAREKKRFRKKKKRGR